MLNTQIALEKMHDRSFKHLFNNQTFSHFCMASPMIQQVKNLSANARDTGDMGLILGSGRSPGWKIPWTEEHGGLLSTGLQRVGHD